MNKLSSIGLRIKNALYQGDTKARKKTNITDGALRSSVPPSLRGLIKVT